MRTAFTKTLAILTALFIWSPGSLISESLAKDYSTLPDDGVPFEVKTDGPVILVADIHGNLDGFISILAHAGVVDANGNVLPTQSPALVIQAGDTIDGDLESVPTENYLPRLAADLKKNGGEFRRVYGNHEVMVSEGDILHVTKSESKYYEDFESGEDRTNAIHSFFAPDSVQGKKLMSLNLIEKVTQTWKDPATGVEKSRSILVYHGGLSQRALSVPIAEYNATGRAWVRYFLYKARAQNLLKAQIAESGTSKEMKVKLKKHLKDVTNDFFDDHPLLDEHGQVVKLPPKNTAWVIGYDLETHSFDLSAIHSPAWARFNRITLDKKTGEPIVLPEKGAMTPKQYAAFLKKNGADASFVGHEPVPDNKKLDIPRQIRVNPRYAARGSDGTSGGLINGDTRIGWVNDPKFGGELSYATMVDGKISFFNEIPRPIRPTVASVRLTQSAAYGIECFKNRIAENLRTK